MLVYRIEHWEKGHGPYVGCWGETEWDPDSKYRSFDSSRPMPEEDGIRVTRDRDFFGFQSLIQLQNWFPPSVWGRMEAVGFVVAVYRIPDNWVKKGRKQVAFPKKKNPCEIIPFSEVENRIRGIQCEAIA